MNQKTNYPSRFPEGKVAYFVTTNFNKFREACRILSEYKISTAQLKISALEIQDDSIEKIAKYSSLDAVQKCKLPIFVEDSGLFIDDLNGFPGPYSKYVYNKIGLAGVLKLMSRSSNRSAYFMTVVAFCKPNAKPTLFTGKVKGTISLEIRGTSGFGYDPIFLPIKNVTKTFGEMSMIQKNRYSHRAKALRKFAEWYYLFNKRRF